MSPIFPHTKPYPYPKASPTDKESTDLPAFPTSQVTLHKQRLVPLQLISATRQSVHLVLLRSQSHKSKLRRSLQRSLDSMQTSDLQRIRERILQTVQLQKLSKRSLLQRNSPIDDKIPPQYPQRFLLNLGLSQFLGRFRLHVLELVHMISHNYQSPINQFTLIHKNKNIKYKPLLTLSIKIK